MRAGLFRFLALGLALGLCGCAGSAQKPAFTPAPVEIYLVELMAQRLELARQVAWIKFQNDAKVKDPKREAELLVSIELQARAIGLSEKVARDFFHAQIAASRRVQEEMIFDWKRGGALPAFPPQDLRRDIRPRLDAISQALLQDLSKLAKIPPNPKLAAYAEWTLAARGFSVSVAREASSPLRAR